MLDTKKNEDQYDEALARVYELMQTDVTENSAESDELKLLSVLVKSYEIKSYPIPSFKKTV